MAPEKQESCHPEASQRILVQFGLWERNRGQCPAPVSAVVMFPPDCPPVLSVLSTAQ